MGKIQNWNKVSPLPPNLQYSTSIEKEISNNVLLVEGN